MILNSVDCVEPGLPCASVSVETLTGPSSPHAKNAEKPKVVAKTRPSAYKAFQRVPEPQAEAQTLNRKP